MAGPWRVSHRPLRAHSHLFHWAADGEKAGPRDRTVRRPRPRRGRGETAGTRKITLFFLSEDDDLLHAEEREVPAGPSLTDDLETAVVELIKGSAKDLVAPFPAETKVRQVFVTKDGTAYVDFTRRFAENFAYGASSEMAAVYALVNTVAVQLQRPSRRSPSSSRAGSGRPWAGTST